MTEVQTTALTVVERAVLALGKKDYGPTLVALAEGSKSITVITNTDGYQQCHAARMALKNERVQITNDGKKARDDANKFNKAVIAEEARLIAIIEPEELRLEKIQTAWDDARAAEKEARIQAELVRVANLQERVAELRGNPNLSPTSGSGLIAEHITDLEALPADESFAEFQQQAIDAKGAGLKRLQDLHAAALAHEAEQQRIIDERAELVRLRAEQTQRDAQDRARRESEEREARKVREAEEARAAEQRRIQREQQDREDAERRRILAEQEAAAKAARDEEARQQESLRQLNESRMSEISGIGQQVMIATLGRAGVRKGGTLECYEETLAETEIWPIEESNFGPMTGMAQKVKDTAIASIREGMAAFRQRQADKAESDRIAAERATLEQEQAALKKAQEPAPAAAPTRMRPKADALEAAVAKEFQVTAEIARDWLRKTYGMKAAHAA